MPSPGRRAGPYGRGVTTAADLRARVEAAFARLDLPSWPDPHPDRSPRDEEYSRLTDPARYRVVHARARVWADVLREAGARAEALPAGEGAADRPFDRGVRLTVPRPGTLALLLLERDVRDPFRPDAEALPVLDVAVARPDVVVETQPDCGCDACDTGSADILGTLDEAVARVVGGPFVALRGDGWGAQWYPDGGSAWSSGEGSAHDQHGARMELCRRLVAGEDASLPPGAEAFVGAPWFG